MVGEINVNLLVCDTSPQEGVRGRGLADVLSRRSLLPLAQLHLGISCDLEA